VGGISGSYYLKGQVSEGLSSNRAIPVKQTNNSLQIKVVDNDGLENMEIVQLKINGVVERDK
jgi:hypothetical protein